MADTTGRTYWSKDPDEAPPYSDWKITFTKLNGDDDDTEQNDSKNDDDDDDKGSDGTNKNKRRKHNTSQVDNVTRSSNKRTISTTTTTYYVHRCMVGPRSEYFTRIFDGNGHGTTPAFSEARNHRSVIGFSAVLTRDAFDHIVHAFELFLDYCYLDSTSTSYKRFLRGNISPVALVFLSDYFQIHHTNFVSHLKLHTEELRNKSSIGPTTKVLFYVMCVICAHIVSFRSEGLSVETMEAILIEWCFNNSGLLLGSSLTKVIDVTLWLSLASYLEDNVFVNSVFKLEEESEVWSINIAHFIAENPELVDNDAFQKLSNRKVLPTIHPTAAIILLKEECRRGLHDRSVVVNNNDNNLTVEDDEHNVEINADDDDSTMLLTNLQQRCVVSFDAANLENYHNIELKNKVLNVMSHTVMKEYLRLNLLRMRQSNTKLSQTTNSSQIMVQKFKKNPKDNNAPWALFDPEYSALPMSVSTWHQFYLKIGCSWSNGHYYLPGESLNDHSVRFTSTNAIHPYVCKSGDYSHYLKPFNEAERKKMKRYFNYGLVPGTRSEWKQIRRLKLFEVVILLNRLGFQKENDRRWSVPEGLPILDPNLRYRSLFDLGKALVRVPDLEDRTMLIRSRRRAKKGGRILSEKQMMALRLRIAEGLENEDGDEPPTASPIVETSHQRHRR